MLYVFTDAMRGDALDACWRAMAHDARSLGAQELFGTALTMVAGRCGAITAPAQRRVNAALMSRFATIFTPMPKTM